jgi:AcrR family transcriptional regulator
MGRWEPDAAGRLREAAIALYLERGYEQTTVADIAERAGVTARTFFRHFADKREVLFSGSEILEESMVAAAAGAPADASPVTAVAAALAAAGEVLGDRHAYARQRSAAVASSVELQERELVKMARLAGALTEALRSRGVSDVEARLVAETGVTAFRVGFERWVTDASDDADLATAVQQVLRELLALRG